MVFNTDITTITASGTLSISEQTYLVDASGGDITITLPNITANGMQYKLVRIDNEILSPPTPVTTTVTVQGFNGSQTINGETNVGILVGKVLDVQSYNDVWYLGNTDVNAVGSSLPYNTIFTTQSNKYLSVNKDNPPTVVGSFYNAGGIKDGAPTLLKAVLLKNSSGTGFIDLRDTANPGTIYASGETLSVGVKEIVTLTLGPATWPTTESIIEIVLYRSSSNGAVEIYSLHLS
jgi:hypothetical protein